MATVFKRPHALIDKSMHYCPGCTHGIIHRLIAEVLDELDIEGKTVGVSPVGCTYNNYEYFNCDMDRQPTEHRRLLQVLKSNLIMLFCLSGDGDLAIV